MAEKKNKICSCCKKNSSDITFTFGLLGVGRMMSLEFCIPCLIIFNTLVEIGTFRDFLETLPKEVTSAIAVQLIEAQQKGLSIPKNIRDN